MKNADELFISLMKMLSFSAWSWVERVPCVFGYIYLEWSFHPIGLGGERKGTGCGCNATDSHCFCQVVVDFLE